MPQCSVFLYDDKLNPLSSTFTQIEILEETCGPVFRRKLDIQTAKPIQTEFGANITLPNPPKPIAVWIDDASGVLGPASFAQLNGELTARLDVILYTLPVVVYGGGGGGKRSGGGGRKRSGGGGGKGGVYTWPLVSDVYMPDIDYALKTLGETSHAQRSSRITSSLASHIKNQIDAGIWSESEASGVLSLVETVTRGINRPKRDTKFTERLERWSRTLESLDIGISVLVDEKRREEPILHQVKRKLLADE